MTFAVDIWHSNSRGHCKVIFKVKGRSKFNVTGWKVFIFWIEKWNWQNQL